MFNTGKSVWHKPPQWLKINLKDDLSVLSPSQYRSAAFSRWNFSYLLWLEFRNSFKIATLNDKMTFENFSKTLAVELYLYDYGWQVSRSGGVCNNDILEPHFPGYYHLTTDWTHSSAGITHISQENKYFQNQNWLYQLQLLSLAFLCCFFSAITYNSSAWERIIVAIIRRFPFLIKCLYSSTGNTILDTASLLNYSDCNKSNDLTLGC